MTRPTGRELKKEICSTLGIKPSLISVRCDGSYYVRLKDYALDKTAVEDIAKKYKEVRYCESSGDILGGGNTFVFVDYASDAVIPDDMKKKVREVIESFNFSDDTPDHARVYHICQKSEIHRDIVHQVMRDLKKEEVK